MHAEQDAGPAAPVPTTTPGATAPETVPRDSAGGWLALLTFLLGNGVSMVGNSLVLVALPWFVLETTGSAARTGVIGMAAALPALLSGLLGGVLVDRLGGRAMSVVSDVISGLAVAMIPLLHATIGLEFWVLAVLVFVGAALDVPGTSARRTLLPALARGAGVRDEAVNSSYETMQSAAFIVGPALAGALIALIGTANLLWITAGGFLLSALLIGGYSPAGRHVPETGVPGAPAGAWQEIKAGLRYLRGDALLFWLAIGLVAMNLLNTPFWGVVLPVLVEQRFGDAAQLGFLFTAFGLGGVAGSIAYGAVGHRFRHRRRLTYLTGLLAFCGLAWAFVADLPYGLMLALAFAEGVLTGPINPLLLTVRLERIPEALRGRVFATFTGLAGAAIPVGMLAAGWLLEGAGLRAGLMTVAVLATIVTAALWRAQPLRAMDDAGDGRTASS